MPSDRHTTLLKQRQLLLDHLAWLDQEIAKENGERAPETTSRLQTTATVETQDRAVSSSELYQELGPDTGTAVADTRRGCLTIFAIAFLGIAALVGWVYWVY